jgi:hypothetical protein
LSSLVASLAILLGPFAASAEAETTVSMTLRGSHGYRVDISGFHNVVELQAAKSVGKGFAYAIYTVHGHVTTSSIHASFPGLGRISARFHPSGQRPRDASCKAGRPIEEAGSFKGKIRFRGEEGFTSISATRVKGSVERSCAGERASRSRPGRWVRAQALPQLFETRLIAVAKTGGRSVELASETAAELSPNGQPTTVGNEVIASLEERHGGVDIDRAALVDAKPITISAPGEVPVTASLTMPEPFSGSASFREEAGIPASWTGDLSIDLPGARDIPLTGPHFDASLCSGKITNGRLRRCEDQQNEVLDPGGE